MNKVNIAVVGATGMVGRKFLEILGYYDPRSEPNKLEIKKDRIDKWLKNGAQYSNRVEKIISSLST